MDRVDADEDICSVVFTRGMPGVFIRRYSAGVLAETAAKMSACGMQFDKSRSVPESPYHVCLRRMTASPVAFIAALNGFAMGGGFELALACVIQIALDEDYDLGSLEINVGLLSGAGGTQRLPQLIGEGRAFEMIARGRTVSPAEALELGIISEIVYRDVVASGMEIAEELSRKSVRAFQNIKQHMRRGLDRPLEEELAYERTLFCDVMVDGEIMERVSELNVGQRDIRVCD